MLTGERRFVSARRGGMTVLGKVTVPKPINLPSQRLENHGLDPNVEIVPKGTLNWGTRSSSSTQNAWASPAQSPPEIGGTGSLNHLNGRPSSGGGTRPSTAGSDRSLEPLPNVWGPSSRPSSSSGVLTSNQTLAAAARPRSAEPRPASSQLSRFAEPSSENPVTWGAPGMLEKLGVSSSRSNDFSLSSGDFPTLGSEKSADSRQGHSSQGRPVSASGRAATPKQRSETSPSEDDSINATREGEAVHTVRNNNFLEVEPRDQPGLEKWQREIKPYSEQNMPPQQFGPWYNAPPHNTPNGVWYRPPFGGGPYGPPGPPGSFPHEPFAYYHSGLPARPAGNLQPVLQPGSTPNGYFPDKGDSHRPQMPDSYIQPVMPYGPGPYPVQVPYDGYYGPPPPRVGSCISSERRPPIMGMATAPCVYNRYPNQNTHPEPGNFHASSGYGPPSNRPMGQRGSGPPHVNRQGPYKVLLKHQDGWDENESEDKREHMASILWRERDDLPGVVPTKEIGLEANRRHDEQVSLSNVSSGRTSQNVENLEVHSHASVGLNLPERTSKVNRVDDSSVRKPETPVNPGEDPQKYMSAKRNPTLIEKIESLNNKARMSDGRYDEKLKALRGLGSKVEDTPDEAGSGIDYPNKAPTSGMPSSAATLEMNPRVEKRLDGAAFNGADVSSTVHEPQASGVRVLNSSGEGMTYHNTQKRPHVAQGRIDNRSKGRSNLPKDEEWRKKPFVTHFPAEGTSRKDENCDDNEIDPHYALRASDKSTPNQCEGGMDMSAFDPIEHKAQRANNMSRAERAKKLQEEEEERTREQKARALAKLEELDRRTLAEVSVEKLDHAMPQSVVSQHKQESSQFSKGPVTDASNPSEVAVPSSGWDSNTVIPMVDHDTHRHVGSTDPPKDVPLEAPICAQQDPVVTNNLRSPVPPEVVAKDDTDNKTSQGHDTIGAKQKQVAYKRKQNMNKNLSDKSIPIGDSSHQKNHVIVEGDVKSLSGDLNPHGNTTTTEDSLPKHKKKNNRSSKTRHKLDEVSSGARSSELVPIDCNSVKLSAEFNKPKTSVSVFEVGSVQVPFSIEIVEGRDSGVLSTDQGLSQPTEEVLSVVNNQLKPHLRRVQRNTQGTRITEKFHGNESVVWAPVGSLKKTENSEDAALNSTVEVDMSSVIGCGTQTNHKSRRAEMERYVPKPVAKELSLQGNTERPPSSSVNQVASDGSSGKGESISLNKEASVPDGLSSGKGGLPIVSKIGETKQIKQGKALGLWRPRNSGESTLVQPPPEESLYSSGPNKTDQKSFQQHQIQKSGLSKEQAKYPDNMNASDNPFSNVSVTDPIVKGHGATNRGKRQQSRGHRTTGNNKNNSDHTDLHDGDTFQAGSQSSSLESNKLDGRVALGENHVVDTHALSHWQPKSQAHMDDNYQGSNRANGGQRFSSRVGKGPKKEYPTQGGEHHASSNEQKPTGAVGPNAHHQENKQQRKGVDASRQDPRIVDQRPAGQAKLKDPPEIGNNLHEQSFSGSRRYGHESRVGRVQEVPHGAQNTGVHDNSKQPPPSNDRGRRDSHYEYQQDRSNGNEFVDSFEEGPRVGGSRYRERGQNHSRHGGGNSYSGGRFQ